MALLYFKHAPINSLMFVPFKIKKWFTYFNWQVEMEKKDDQEVLEAVGKVKRLLQLGSTSSLEMQALNNLADDVFDLVQQKKRVVDQPSTSNTQVSLSSCNKNFIFKLSWVWCKIYK